MVNGIEPQLAADVLGRWLDENGAPGGGGKSVLRQLKGGSQNTLFLIDRGDHRMVLRMPGAHADLIAADDTASVLGMPFYVMRAIEGWSPMDGGWAAPFGAMIPQLIATAAELARSTPAKAR